MTQRKWFRAGCLGIVLASTSAIVWGTPQDQPQKPPFTQAEYNAYYKAATYYSNQQVKLKLLDAFIAQYPNSALLNCAYLDYSDASRFLGKFPESVEYADRFLTLDETNPETCPGRAGVFNHAERLQALLIRAQAYAWGCNDSAFHTPEAEAKARDFAIQGLQVLSQFQVPQRVGAPPYFRSYVSGLFNSVASIAESDLQGSSPADSCKTGSTGKFNDMIDHIHSQARQDPQVR